MSNPTLPTTGYAFFPTHKSVTELQDKIDFLENQVNRMKKHVALAKAENEAATRRVDEWCRWATAAKSSIQAMPPSSLPTIAMGPQVESETTRSRSPRQIGEYRG